MTDGSWQFWIDRGGTFTDVCRAAVLYVLRTLVDDIPMNEGCLEPASVANPVAPAWAGAMTLRHLGFEAAATAVETAVETVIADTSLHTRDLGGKASTAQVGKALAEIIAG
ncbi:MAG: isocitrate/isopropylmalate family dehydrogenase [Gammaproteobacteria bacterium]